MAKLDQICTLNMGQSPDSSSYNENGSGMPFFQGNADFGKTHPKVRVWCSAPTKIAHAGDVLISVRAPIGALNIADRDCCIGRGLAALTVNEEICNKDYLWYAIASKVDELNSKGTGSTFKAISKSVLAETEIPLPSLEEQQSMAKQLAKIDELISLRKEQLTKLDRLVKSRFIELFGDPMENPMGWDRVNISAVVGGKVSNGFFAKRDDYCDDGNVKVLGVAHVVNRMYSNVEDLPITNGTEADVAKYGVKYGDMLFCRSSLVAAGIGKASIVPKDTPNNVLFECHVIRLPLALNKCVPEFMQVLSTTDYFRNQVIAQSKTATMTTIGQDGILKTDIILPPLELQKQFLKFVEQTDKSKLAIQQSLDKLELLKKSLMQEYFG